MTSLILVSQSPTQNQVDLKNPPLHGEVSYLLYSLIKNPEAREEDPPRRICIKCFEGGPLRPDLSVCLIFSVKPENPYFASCRGLENKILGDTNFHKIVRYVTERPNILRPSRGEVKNDVWRYLLGVVLSLACTHFVGICWITRTVHLARICGGFSPLCIVAPRTQTCHFFCYTYCT